MIRTVTPLAAALLFGAAATAQPAIHNGHGGRTAPQPAGVIAAPSLPFPGAPGVPGVTPTRPLPRPYFGNALYGSFGYAPAYYWPWPGIEDVDFDYPAMVRAAQFYPAPAYLAPTYPTVVATPAPVEQRARLQLTVPPRAKVWLAGKEVDANASPLELASPPLEPGQTYTFDVKITWPAGDKTEERTRTVSVEAGERTSLTYFQ